MIRKRWIILGCMCALVLFVWINNTNLFADRSGTYKLLAHRGLAQTFDVSQVEWNTNTAKMIYEPEHGYLENTIDSMAISFEYGAELVELDVQLTKDGQLAVFHDYDLSMRTDTTGSPSEYTMDELRKLDIGYGYTADEGQTYPFRGKGIGLMPELKEVLEAFPDKKLLIHMKHGNVETAKALWTYLERLTPEHKAQITVYGNDEGLIYLRERCETIRVLSTKILKKALLHYVLLGWTGYIPKAIHNMEIHIPLSYAKYLWGWPSKFVERMESVNSQVVIVEGNGKWSEGFDSLESLKAIPDGFTGYIWTNRIDRIAGN